MTESVYPSGVEAAPSGVSSQEADAADEVIPDSGLADLVAPGSGRARRDPPLPRWKEGRAELPALRAQLRRAERKRDVERERLIAAALARALVKRRAELDIAVRLARRAVLLGEDSLRTDLAAWHCQLGQTELGVGMLLPLLEAPGLDRSRLCMRIALYSARLGQADQALSALREAAAYDPEDPLIQELQATIYGWAPHTTSAAQAADAYSRGAERRRARRDAGAAFQDVLRAFDTAPAHLPAAEALARALAERGQGPAADEVWRRYADALLELGQTDEGCAVHRRRFAAALAAGRLHEALAAGLDGRLDAQIDAEVLAATVEEVNRRALSNSLDNADPGAGAPRARRPLESEPPLAAEQGFDGLLGRLGLSELLAARLELAAEAAHGALAGRCYLALGNFLERSLGSSERALEAWVLAVVADPESEPARAALLQHAASTGDYSPLVAALERVAGTPLSVALSGRLACLRELRELARERLDDPGLALWCVQTALRYAPGAADLIELGRELDEPARLAERSLEEALGELRHANGDQRVGVLRQVAALLRGKPDRAELYREVLGELVLRRPEELRWRRLLEALLARLRDRAGLSQLWTRDLLTEADPNPALRALLGLSRLERQAGNLQGALAVLAADNRGLGPAASMQLCLAAQLGQRRLRAHGLLGLGGSLPPLLRAWLASVASADFLLLGELQEALRAAEVGTHADPSLTRPIVAFAQAAAGRRDRVAAVAFERAMALTFPSSAHCRGLVAALDGLGDVYAAQVWTGRWLGLRPAETAAAIELLRTSAKTGDAARLGDVVQWTISQAHPLEGWAEPLAGALTSLVELDRARAAQVAWRVLDAFGPTPGSLRQALHVVATESADTELEIALIERELASDAVDTDVSVLWRLAQLHFERGEPDRACAVLVRALAAGLDPERVLALLAGVPETHSTEGEFHRIQATAQAYELSGDKSDACVRALREYGAALWDLARDQAQAVDVWLRAAELGGAQGWFDFARDLVEVLGLDRALDEVCRLAESREAPDQVAALLTGAAVVAQRRGGRRRALQLGLLALDTDPANVWALELIESAALEADLPSVERAYRSALGATLGAYGERALHYRAARFFERAGDLSLALTHAIGAFRAVPSEGVTFALMLRLAPGAKEAERASRAIEEVASAQSTGAARSQWLRRAALIAGRTADGAQQRMEVLLRALFAEPETGTVDLLARAFTDLSRQQHDGRALGLLRFSRAVSKLLPRLESIDGARVALAMGSVALACFSDTNLAFEALAGAASLDPEAEEFVDFVPEAGRLVTETEAANAFIDAVEKTTDGGQRGSLGLLELSAELAIGLGRPGVAAGFLVQRLERGPENEVLAAKAEQVVRKSRQLHLPEHVLRRFPVPAKHAQLLARAEQALAAEDVSAEFEALARAFQIDARLPAEALGRLFRLARDVGNLTLAEQVLEALRQNPEADRETVLQVTLALSAALLEQRHPERALLLLREACAQEPDDLALWTQALAAARAAGDDEQRQKILDRLIDVSGDTVKRTFWLNEAWELAQKRGEPELGTQILQRWLTVDPEDTQALSRLEAAAEARQAWEELAELLARHLAIGVSFRERRRLMLWRSELLETRLGQLAEARQELAVLVEQAPADREVIERFAQLSEALGEAPAAASAWLTASGLSSTRPVAAQLAERACRLFLDAGEVLSARRVLAAPQTVPRTLGLARLSVRLERDGANEPRLARALEELGAIAEQPLIERAQSLLEAANLWRRLGDDERACQCAGQAANWLPDDSEAQILASYLEYRRGGPRSPAEARPTVERLRRVYVTFGPEQLDLAGFLLAEALDVLEPGSGMAELTRVRDRLGDTPLISAAIGERLASGPSARDALPHFDSALLGGDLRGLRKRSQLALAAAHVALRSNLLGLAHRYAKQAEADSELSDAARRLREEIARALPSVPPSASVPSSVWPPSTRSSRPPQAPFTAAVSEALDHETRPARRTQLGLGRTDPRPPVAASGESGTSSETAKNRLRFQMPRPVPTPRQDRSPSSDVMPRVLVFRARTDEERERFEKLSAGSVEAGRELARDVLREPERAGDAGALGLEFSRLSPGDPAVLDLLLAGAAGTGDHVHAAALRHVQSLADPGGPEIPPLDGQLERVDVLRRLLFSDSEGQPPKALEVIWESTRRVLEWESLRDAKSAQRVRADDPSGLARAYFAVARLFGLAPTPLLQLAQPGDAKVSVLMLGEPSVLVRGGASEDTLQLRYDLGAALAGTLPAYAILNAATYGQIDDLFRAVNTAFGPPETSQTNFTSTARLAALLWESLPPRTQRLMTEWCREGKLTRELAAGAARRAARRAGLFACGSLGVALGRVIADEGIDPGVLRGREGLGRLCARSPAASDLVRLACDPLYAHLRWRTEGSPPGGPITRRGL